MALGHLPTLGPRDAAHYRRLGDTFADAASRASAAADARQLMLAARDAWARAEDLGDSNLDEAAFDKWLGIMAGGDEGTA